MTKKKPTLLAQARKACAAYAAAYEAGRKARAEIDRTSTAALKALLILRFSERPTK